MTAALSMSAWWFAVWIVAAEVLGLISGWTLRRLWKEAR